MSEHGAASAFVEIVPDFAHFGEKLGAGVEGPIATIAEKISHGLGMLPGGPIVTGVIGGAVAIGASLAAIGEKFQESYNKIRAATGATDTQMKGLETAFKNVLKSGPDSFSKVADAIGLVSVRTKLTGTDLQGFTETELRLARITGQDVKTQVDATTKALANYGKTSKEDASQGLEQLYAASTKTGISVDELASSVSGKAGAAFRAFGVDIGGASSILGSLSAAGIPATSVVMGLQKVFTDASKSGQDAHKELAGIFEQMKTGTPGTAAYGEAIKVLGARSFGTLRDAVIAGKISIADFTSGALKVPDSIDRIAEKNETLGQTFARLKNVALVALEPIATKVLHGLELAVKGVIDVFHDLAPVFGTISAAVHGLILGFTGGVGAVTAFQAPFVDFGAKVWRILHDVWTAWETFTTALRGDGAAFDDAKGVFLVIAKAGFVLRDVFIAVKGYWDEFVGGFQNPEAKLGGLKGAERFFIQFGQVVEKVFEFLDRNIKPILIGVGLAFALLVSPVAVVAAGLIYLYTKFEAARQIMQVIGGLIKDVVVFAFKQIAAYVQLVVGAFGDLIAFVQDVFAGRWGAAFDDLVDIPKKWFKYLGETFGNLIGLFEGLPHQIINELGKLPGQLAGLAADAAKWLLGLGVSAVTGLLNGMISWLPKVGEWLLLLPVRIAGFIIGAELWLVEKGTHILGGVITGFINKLPDIGLWLLELPLKIIAFVIGAELWLVEKGVKIIAGLVTGLINNLPAIAKFIVDLPGKIVGFIGDAGKWLVGEGVKVIQGFVDDLVAGWPILWSWLKGLPKQILDALGDVGSWLFDVGKKVIDGLIAGIKKAAEAIPKAIGNIAGGAVEAFKSRFGISSPSKVFMEMGGNLMEGLGMGVAAKAHLPENAVRGLRLLPGGLDPRLPAPSVFGSPSVPSPAAGGPLVGQIIFQVGSGQDPQSYADAVTPKLETVLRDLAHGLKVA